MATSNCLNILFTCAGRKVSLLRSFRAALDTLGLEGTFIGVDSAPLSAALYECDVQLLVPPVKDESYIDTLVALCRQYQVDLLVPLIDVDLLVLAKHRERFREQGTLALISPLPTVQLCRDKRLTAEFFAAHNIPTIPSYSPVEVAKDGLQFPLFIKPAVGSGSINSFRVTNAEELDFYLNQIPNPLIQAYAGGQEYTIDALMDLEGKVVNIVPRRRLEVRAGEISKGVTCKNWNIIRACEGLLQQLDGIGPMTVQCFVQEDQVLFTEINPRVGGGIPLTIAAGADYPLQILRMVLGETVAPCIGEFEDELYMFRYEDAVFRPGEIVHGVPASRPV